MSVPGTLREDRDLLDALADPGVVTVAGDWHGEASFAEAVVARAEPGLSGRRVVLQLGDIGIAPGEAGRRYLDDLAALAGDLDAVVLFVDGNHDDQVQILDRPLRDEGLRPLRPRIVNLPRGFRWRWHGATWIALGGAHTISRPRRTPGVDWWPEELITEAQAAEAIAGGRADVMATHDCPAGIALPGIRDPAPGQPQELYDELVEEAKHRQLVRSIVEALRPRRLLHGHYHVRHDAELALADGDVCTVTSLGGSTDVESNFVTLDLAAGGIAAL